MLLTTIMMTCRHLSFVLFDLFLLVLWVIVLVTFFLCSYLCKSFYVLILFLS